MTWRIQVALLSVVRTIVPCPAPTDVQVLASLQETGRAREFVPLRAPAVPASVAEPIPCLEAAAADVCA